MPVVRILAVLFAFSAAAAPAQPPRAPTAPPDPVPANPVVRRGVDLWQAGDYARAVAAWRDPAERGDADAQFNLAQAYKLGRGVPTDQRMAERWYRKAADQGHRQAGGYLGLIMFRNGDRAGAMPWLSSASDQGDPRAQYLYGTALFNGENVAKDWPRAYAMMTASAAAGLPQASTTLKQMDAFIPLEDRQRGLKMVSAMRDAATAPGAPRVETAAIRPPAPVAPPATVPTQATAPEPAPVRMVTATPPAAPQSATVAKSPPQAAAPSGHWRIQVGAYGSEAGARTAWATLRATPALAKLSPTYRKAGTVVRLQLGPLPDRAAATRLCAAARVAACFPVTG